jgi:hypothetical protein
VRERERERERERVGGGEGKGGWLQKTNRRKSPHHPLFSPSLFLSLPSFSLKKEKEGSVMRA